MATRIYRWIVFGMAAFYMVWMLLLDADYTHIGGPFRFLTIWALIFSFISASRMMALMEHRSTRDWPALVAVTGTLNFMVVFLYWRLFLADPANVSGPDGPAVWWVQYYVHLLGPVLQWGDMLFLHRNIRAYRTALVLLLVVIAAYIAWVELIVSPMNSEPLGDVTSGLPYPFLNDLELPGRLAFYGQTIVSALVVLTVIYGITRFLRNEAPAGPSDSPGREA